MLLDSYIFHVVRKELEVQKILIVFCCAALLALVMQRVIQKVIEISKLPPGPYGVFPFGILKFIGGEMHTEFMRLAKSYGQSGVFSCKLGTQLYVVINDYKLIRELLKRESVTDRPKTPLYAVLNGAGKCLGVQSEKKLEMFFSSRRRSKLNINAEFGKMRSGCPRFCLKHDFDCFGLLQEKRRNCDTKFTFIQRKVTTLIGFSDRYLGCRWSMSRET
jgi:Cytochrome P450